MDKIYNKNSDVVFRKIADEFVLVPIRQKVVDLKSIYTLNETSAFIWEQIDGKNDVSRIINRLAENFEVDSAQAKADVLDLVGQLNSLGLVEEV